MTSVTDALARLEKESLKDYATEEYFKAPQETRGEAAGWIKDYMENLVKTNRSKVNEITRDYARARSAVSR